MRKWEITIRTLQLGLDPDNGSSTVEIEEQGLKGDRTSLCCSVCSRRLSQGLSRSQPQYRFPRSLSEQRKKGLTLMGKIICTINLWKREWFFFLSWSVLSTTNCCEFIFFSWIFFYFLFYSRKDNPFKWMFCKSYFKRCWILKWRKMETRNQNICRIFRLTSIRTCKHGFHF